MGALTTAACVLALPATLAHELTHYGAARLAGTDDAQIAVEVTGAGAVAAWRPIDSRPLRAFAFLAPTVFGVLLTATWIAAGVTVDGWRLIMALGLAIYTVPSGADIEGRSEEHTSELQSLRRISYAVFCLKKKKKVRKEKRTTYKTSTNTKE